MRYGSVLPSSFVLPKSSFWIQKDLTEEGNPFKLLPEPAGMTVMDCGGYAGTFSVACLEQGAEFVRVYEAMPVTAVTLRANLDPYGSRADLIGAALVDDTRKEAVLSLSGFTGANTILAAKNPKEQIVVPAVNFRTELLRTRPQMLKLDVEGAEYALLDSLETGDLVSVTSLFLEFHPIDERDRRIAKLSSYLADEGFTILSSRRRTFTAVREESSSFLF